MNIIRSPKIVYCPKFRKSNYFCFMKAKYVNPFTDFGFKKIFGEEASILDFKFDDKVENGIGEVIHTVQLKDQKNKVFYEKLKFVYLEMPHFIKEEHELETRLDKWLYFIKRLEDFQNIPEIFKDDVFIQAFKTAEIAKYNEDERYDYEQSLKVYRDLKAVIDTAFDDGKSERTFEIAKTMKKNGVATEIIMMSTGLTKEIIDSL